MSHADPFDFRDTDTDSESRRDRLVIRTGGWKGMTLALVVIGVALLGVVTAGVGYFIWRDVESKRDAAKMDRLEGEITAASIELFSVTQIAVRPDADTAGRDVIAAVESGMDPETAIRKRVEAHEDAWKRAERTPAARAVTLRLNKLKQEYNDLATRYPQWQKKPYTIRD